MKKTGLILTLIMAFCTAAYAQGDDFSRIRVSPVPQPVPPLVFENPTHGQHALSEFRGRYVLLNVWATWCPPCVKEMPSLAAVQNHFDPRWLVVLPLSEDHDPAEVWLFLRAHKLAQLPVAVDTEGRAPSVLHLNGLPTTLLIDPKGNEIARLEGPADWTSPEAMAFLRAKIR